MNGGGHLEMPGEERVQQQEPRRISVTLTASNDAEKDRRKLQRIHNRLMNYPGQDRFRIIVMRGGVSTSLDFPDQTTNICQALRDDLVEIVGSAEFIVVDDEI